MKITLNELRSMVREELEQMFEDIVAKDMPNGSAWKTKKNGWGAKNHNGVTNYYYGPDESGNREKANKFKDNSTKKKSDFLKKETALQKLAGAALSELSPQTTNSYISKAVDSRGKARHASRDAYDSGQNKTGDHHADTAHKREKGIATARKKTGSWQTASGKKATRAADGSVKYEEK